MNYCTCPIENRQDVPDKVCLVCNKPTSSYLTEGPNKDITYSCRRCKYLYHTVDSSGLFTVEKYRCRKLNDSTVPYNLETPQYCPFFMKIPLR